MMHGLLAEFLLPRSASTQAPAVDWVFNFVLWVNIIFTVLILSLLILFVIRYRHREGVKTDTSPGHNNTLEIAWTVIPTILVLFIFYFGFRGYLHAAVDPPNAYEITATGRMWSWSFTYPNNVTSNELHVPSNTPVRLVLQSEDVIHSLYIPEFRVKKDVVPGRFNRMWFEAHKLGTQNVFDLYCAGYCGTQHSVMLTKVYVDDPPEFDKWMQGEIDWRPRLSPIEAGRKFYQTRGCMGCHSVDGSKVVGPTWKDMYGSTVPLADGTTVTADDAYVHESILEPAAKIHAGFQNVMPSFKGQFTEYDIAAITWYMKSISANFKGDLTPAKSIAQTLGPTTSPTTVQPAVNPAGNNVGKGEGTH